MAMMKTQLEDSKADLQAAVNKAAFKGAETGRKGAVSPLNGAVMGPGPGRPKGTKDRVYALREAVLTAFDMVGGAAYLAKLAEGNSSDRAAFVGLVSKIIPAQINADVSGGIQVQLSWLGQRNIGTVTTQAAEVVTQVVDLQKDSKGKYRIGEPSQAETEGQGQSEKDSDPLPPIESGIPPVAQAGAPRQSSAPPKTDDDKNTP